MNELVIPTGEKKPNVAIIQAERDALLAASRKFREESPPQRGYSTVEIMWSNLQDDGENHLAFDVLNVGVQDWSRRVAKDGSQLDNLQGHERELFFKEAAKVVLLEGSDKQEFPKGLRFPGSLRSILASLLTHHIFATIFSDPFFFLGEEASQILNDLMSLGNISNLGYSQRWRSDTLRLIHPLQNNLDDKMVRSETKKLLRNAATSLATKFMRSPAKYIVNDHPDALQRLVDVYMMAAEHSYLLWANAPMMELLDTNFLGQPFDSRNENMEASPRVYQISEIAPDGQKISMVESPAILRYGLREADAGYYEKRWWHGVSVYRPARVWFYLPKPSSPGLDEENFEPMALPPQPSKDSQPLAFPIRSKLSVEALGERMRKRFDRVILLDLVKPYLDDFAEQLRPVVEGLSGEIAQRIEERNEMEKQRDEFRSKYREALQSIERLKSGM